MDGADLWAMLAPHGPRVIVAARGYGSLSANDIRLMLKDLAKGPMLMGMVFDAGDHATLRQLEIYLWCRINERAVAQGWQYHKDAVGEPRKPFDRRMAQLVLIEIAQDEAGRVSKKCGVCGGLGYIVKHAQPMLCDSCHGLRSARLTHKDRADYCGCSTRNWHQSWTRRYSDVHEMARDWLYDARAHLKTRVNKFFNVA